MDGNSLNVVTDPPEVSVVTPVYNDAEYIEECIASVASQTYDNFEYIICDNHSTDRSGELARELTADDPRMRVVQPPSFLPQQQNFNFALSQISPQARFVKMILADDWMFPNNLAEMVGLAVAHPSVGVVSAYGLVETAPICFGLPPDRSVFNGDEARRAQILGVAHPFGSPTNLLFRADLVRERLPEFFPEKRFYFDLNVCFELLRTCDFGFVHQVLAFARKQPESVMVNAFQLRTDELMAYVIAREYGPEVLEPAEFADRMAELTDALYLTLGRGWIEEKVRRKRNDELWEFQQRELAAVGTTIDSRLLAKGVVRALAVAAANPGAAITKLSRRLRGLE